MSKQKLMRYRDISDPYAQKESGRALPRTLQRQVRSRSRRPRVHALEGLAIVDEMAFRDPGGTQTLDGRAVLHVLRSEELLPSSVMMSDDDISAFCPPVNLLASS